MLCIFAVPETIVSKFLSVQAVTSYTLQFIAARGQPDVQPWATHAHFSQYLVPETRLIPTKSVPECPILIDISSGGPHFHARASSGDHNFHPRASSGACPFLPPPPDGTPHSTPGKFPYGTLTGQLFEGDTAITENIIS